MATLTSKMKSFLPPILWIVVFEVVSAFIGLTSNTPENMVWYDTLEKSVFTPPDQVFSIVWPILYALIALTGFKIWQSQKASGHKTLLAVFIAYILLNWAWSYVFFNLHLVLTAFIIILIMNILNAYIIAQYNGKQKSISLLMTPPLLWTSFAMYLTFTIWLLNS